MLAFRLFAAADTLGALDLYGTRLGAFDEAARAFGSRNGCVNPEHARPTRRTLRSRH